MPPWYSPSENSFYEGSAESSVSGDLIGNLGETEKDSIGDLLPLETAPSASATQQSTPVRLCSPHTAPTHDDETVYRARRPNSRLEIRLPKSTLVKPRARYDGWNPPAPSAKESVALTTLTRSLKASTDTTKHGFIELELDKFSVYVQSLNYPCELRPLQQLSTKKGGDQFYLDGILRAGENEFYVERVAFSELPIGNYGISHDTVDDQIWIRSRANSQHEIYYRLKTPATEYERFYTPFLWIANLAKHVVDYCSFMATKNTIVALKHFQQKFIDWLSKTHGDSANFQRWRRQHGSDDFRTAIVANVEFIWKEACGVLQHRMVHSLHVFREIKHLTQYRPFMSVLGDKRNPVQPLTIVTPYIYRCFGHSEFGRLLEPLQRSHLHVSDCSNEPGLRTIKEVKSEPKQGATTPKSQTRPRCSQFGREQMIEDIKAGDTISTPPDNASTGTKWRKEVAKGAVEDHRWFGLVQKVHVAKNGARSFDVTWLYRPVDTPCCKMVYPWSNELFLSDHCTCEEGRNARVDEDEVIAVHEVDWFSSPEASTAEFFVRQTYQVEQRRWVTLERRHMTCDHDKPDRFAYKAGDTVLAVVSDEHVSDKHVSDEQERADVFEVVKVFYQKQGKNRFVRLRRLIRRCELDQHLRGTDPRPNELVYTDEMVVVKTQCIRGKCIVRIFGLNEPLPCPYDRNGTANVFFITHKLGDGVCFPLGDCGPHSKPTMRQGFDPNQRVKKLRGLDLFCGSGNFGRGLEEGGAVEMRWANDIWTEAIHTYMANSLQHHTKPFLGSVDDLLRCAIEGNHSDGVPRQGDVDFISGGSPCQGFSLITNDKTDDRQKKNRSLVASFASFVDFYRPKYGILENVINIVQTGVNREEDAFSQLICAIVGMGYQTQLTLGDAWTYGAPQSRSRVFLYFAAPGYRLPDPPRPSHSHFEGVKGRGLGRMTQGESFVRRSFEPTAFKFVSAAESTADLPEIHDAKADYCIGHPDHRVSIGMTSKTRRQYARIPIHPYGMSFAKAWNQGNGVMTPAERELFPPTGSRVKPNSKGWGRIPPTNVFHTITTCVTPTDARTGRFLHWRENRPITVLEARRAQGFLDHEVLVGSLTSQYELVGNSVARQMALALGLQFREAWLGTLYDDRDRALASAVEYTDTALAELEVGDVEDEKKEVDWDDDGDSLFVGDSRDSPGLEETGAPTAVATTPTSISDTASRKRSLSQSLAVEMPASKAPKAGPEYGNATNGASSGGARSQTTSRTFVVSSSTTITVEREPTAGSPGTGFPSTGGPGPSTGYASQATSNLVVRSVIDLTVENPVDVESTVVQSSTAMIIDLTDK